MNFVISINLSLKYQRLTTSGYKEKEIGKFEFVANTQFPLTIFFLTMKLNAIFVFTNY